MSKHLELSDSVFCCFIHTVAAWSPLQRNSARAGWSTGVPKVGRHSSQVTSRAVAARMLTRDFKTVFIIVRCYTNFNSKPVLLPIKCSTY